MRPLPPADSGPQPAGTEELARARRDHFTALFDAHYPQVLAYARRRLGPDLADDVVADTFLAAWGQLDRVRPGGAWPHERAGDELLWLYGLERGVVSHHRRRIERLARLDQRLVAQGPRPIGGDHGDLVGWQDQFAAAFAALTELEREALRITAWEGLAPAQGAVVLGCSVTAFKVRLHRARRRLRLFLESDTADRRRRAAGSLGAAATADVRDFQPGRSSARSSTRRMPRRAIGEPSRLPKEV